MIALYMHWLTGYPIHMLTVIVGIAYVAYIKILRRKQ